MTGRLAMESSAVRRRQPGSSPVLRRCGSHACPPTGCTQERERSLLRSGGGPGPEAEAPPIVEEVLRSPGRPLDDGTRASMESALGHDFSRVRVHDDARAAASALAVNALAYTVGSDVVFAPGRFDPATQEGRGLLAHELVHTVQQDGSPPGGPILVGSSDAPEEVRARSAADASFAAQGFESGVGVAGPQVLRRQDGGPGGGGGGGGGGPTTVPPSPPAGTAPTTFSLNITPQIQWAIGVLGMRPVREEDTWVCLGGVPEYDKPRILLNYLIQYRGNSAFAQIDAQRPQGMDRDLYLDSVASYLWSLIRAQFMAMVMDRMRRVPSFRAKVERAAGGEGCARVPARLPPGTEAA